MRETNDSERRGFSVWNDPLTKGLDRAGRPLKNLEMHDMHNFVVHKVRQAVKTLNTSDNRCPMCKHRDRFFVDFKNHRLMCLACGNRFSVINFKEL
jgi:hypothetical protein